MSPTSSTPDMAQAIARQSATDRLLAACKRWWVAYIARRTEQAEIIALRAMSDRQLKDIGLVRSDITWAVKRTAAWNRAFRHEDTGLVRSDVTFALKRAAAWNRAFRHWE